MTKSERHCRKALSKYRLSLLLMLATIIGTTCLLMYFVLIPLEVETQSNAHASSPITSPSKILQPNQPVPAGNVKPAEMSALPTKPIDKIMRRANNTPRNTNDDATTHRCILYDRPLRTGSSTIGGTLSQCLKSKGYYVLPSKGRNITRENVPAQFIHSREKTTRRASVEKHLYVTPEDVRRMRASCDDFLYVSSCSPMVPRLTSVAKYETFEGHGNTSIGSTELVDRLMRRLKGLLTREEFLEQYPYTYGGVAEAERWTPDYVIRREDLETDLRALLDALGCAHVAIESRNVHQVEFGRNVTDSAADSNDYEDSRFEKREQEKEFNAAMERARDYLTMGDGRYLTLLNVAGKVNEKGLRMAGRF